MKIDIRLPVIDPAIKLEPMMKLIGKFTVSFAIRLIFFLLALFWIPTINNKKIEVLKIKMKIIFLLLPKKLKIILLDL